LFSLTKYEKPNRSGRKMVKNYKNNWAIEVIRSNKVRTINTTVVISATKLKILVLVYFPIMVLSFTRIRTNIKMTGSRIPFNAEHRKSTLKRGRPGISTKRAPKTIRAAYMP